MFQTNLLWQNDSRWAGNILGGGPPTIKDWGCLLTSMTMVVNGYGHNETPATLNDKMKTVGGFSGAAVLPFKLPALFPDIAYLSLDEYVTTPAPMTRIDAALSASKPVIIRVDWSPNPGLQDHWVLLCAKDGSDYLMFDPYQYSGDVPNGKSHLVQRYHYSGTTPAEVITGVLWLDKSGASPASTSQPAPATTTTTTTAAKVPVPANAVKVYVTQDQLAFRGAPSVTGALIRRYALDAALTSLENAGTTNSKVGQINQWLQVQGPEGDQGYVAAWYVSLSRASSSAAGTATGASGTVKVTQDQLAFRSQPVIADNNIIARFPLGTVLTVTDPQAAQKIGVMNQWLQVKDSNGRQGYVAAWYVS